MSLASWDMGSEWCTDSCDRRIENTKSTRKDFIHYILKQGEHYDLSQDEVIVNAALFM
jgi:hypothetical protein